MLIYEILALFWISVVTVFFLSELYAYGTSERAGPLRYVGSAVASALWIAAMVFLVAEYYIAK